MDLQNNGVDMKANRSTNNKKNNPINHTDSDFDSQIAKEINDYLPIGVFVLDAEHECLYANKAFWSLVGSSINGNTDNGFSIFHPSDRQRIRLAWHELQETNESVQIEFRVLRQQGDIIWTRISYSKIPAQSRYIGHMLKIEYREELAKLDIQYKKRSEFDRREKAESTLDSIGEAVISTDINGIVTFMNVVAEQMTGWLRDQALGQPLHQVFHIVETGTGKTLMNPGLKAMNENKTLHSDIACSLMRKDGYLLQIEDSAAPILNRFGEITGAVVVFHDITELQSKAAKLAHLARYDTLTDLPNRRLLEERCMEALIRAKSEDKSFALIFIDIDNFKDINDSLGHMVGDFCLQFAANILTKCTRVNDTVCRHGGDEFVILLSNIRNKQDALSVAKSIKTAFLQDYDIQGNILKLSISMGISIYPEDGTDIHTLMLTADKTMYSAKKNGKNCFAFSS